MPYPTTPKTWVAGDVLTAAQMNAELRDALLGAFPLGPPDGAWTAYTPTLAQPAAVTKTVGYAKYTRVGRLITVQMVLNVTGTGTAATAFDVGLPVAAAFVGGMVVGSGYLYDASSNGTYKGVAYLSTTTAFRLHPANVITANPMGVDSFTQALAVGDALTASVSYESAT